MFYFDLLDNDFMSTTEEKTDMGGYVPSKQSIDKLVESIDTYTRTFEVHTEDGIIKIVHNCKEPYPEMYFE